MTVLTVTGLVQDCAVSQRAAGANMSVDVTAGRVNVGNTVAVVTATNVAISAADATLYRIDAVVVDSSGTVSVIAGSLLEIGYAPAPSTTGYALLAYVTVVPSGDPNYTGTITNAMISDQRTFYPASATGCFVKRTIYTSGSAATHTWDARTTQAIVRMVGAGGGGGGAKAGGVSGNQGAGGGGAAGGYLEKLLTAIDVTATPTATYTVGSKGTGGTGSSGSNGNTGNDSTLVFNAVTYTAKGGLGGNGVTVSATNSTLGGDGQAPTNGDVNVKGQPGGSGFASGSTICASGQGGGGPFGQGAIGAHSVGAGNAAQGNGAGGSGGVASSAASNNGGDGTDGIIVIDEYT